MMSHGNLAWIKAALSEVAVLKQNLQAGGLSWVNVTRGVMEMAELSDQVPALLAEIERLRGEVNELKLCLEESAENGGTWNV